MLLGQNGYATATSNGEFEQDIQNMWNKGLGLVDVEYGDGIWFGTFQEDSSIRTGYTGGSTFDELVGNFQQLFGTNQGWELVDVEYGDGVWLGVTEQQTPQNTAVGDALLPLQLSIEGSMNSTLGDVLYDYGSVDYYGG